MEKDTLIIHWNYPYLGIKLKKKHFKEKSLKNTEKADQLRDNTRNGQNLNKKLRPLKYFITKR